MKSEYPKKIFWRLYMTTGNVPKNVIAKEYRVGEPRLRFKRLTDKLWWKTTIRG